MLECWNVYVLKTIEGCAWVPTVQKWKGSVATWKNPMRIFEKFLLVGCLRLYLMKTFDGNGKKTKWIFQLRNHCEFLNKLLSCVLSTNKNQHASELRNFITMVFSPFRSFWFFSVFVLVFRLTFELPIYFFNLGLSSVLFRFVFACIYSRCFVCVSFRCHQLVDSFNVFRLKKSNFFDQKKMLLFFSIKFKWSQEETKGAQ